MGCTYPSNSSTQPLDILDANKRSRVGSPGGGDLAITMEPGNMEGALVPRGSMDAKQPLTTHQFGGRPDGHSARHGPTCWRARTPCA